MDKPRYRPIVLKTSGKCPQCRNELMQGDRAFWDNATGRRVCSPCGESAITHPMPPVPGKLEQVKASGDALLQEMTRLVSTVSAMEKKIESYESRLTNIEEDTAACKLMLIALLDKLQIEIPGSEP